MVIDYKFNTLNRRKTLCCYNDKLSMQNVFIKGSKRFIKGSSPVVQVQM